MIFSSMYTKDYKRMLYYASQGIAAAVDENKDFYYFAGLAAYQLKKYAQAGAFLKSYLSDNPNDGNAFYYLGLTLRGLGDPAGAAKLFQRAGTLHGGTPFNPQETIISLDIF